jgi:hypothetical protein
MAAVSLIVMEHGSEWPGHVGNIENVVVVEQDHEALLARTREGLASLHRRGHHVHVGVLACNETTGGVSASSRAEVVVELLTALNAGRFGRLVLTTGSRASLRLRAELLSLASALDPHLRGTAATVAVKFGGHIRSGHLSPTLARTPLVAPHSRVPRDTGLDRRRG